MNRPSQRIDAYDRFCPGEERIKISDAVCTQRRKSNFPKCKGCQFNENGQAPELTPTDDEQANKQATASVFKAYDVRATCPDPLNPEIVWRIGQATAQFLRTELRGYDRGLKENVAIIVGRDMRKTSPELSSALQEGIRSVDCRVIDIGMIDGPQMTFAVNHLPCCGGIVVTAGHLGPEYNGLNICGQKAKPVSIDTGLNKIAAITASTTRQNSSTKLAACEQADLSADYKTFVRGFLKTPDAGTSAERPLRVVIDASNGMAGRWVPLLFNEIDWLDITPLNFEHNGHFVHDSNPLIDSNLRQLADRVIRSKADFGICFDGDAGRCMLVDEKGQIVRGDFLTVLLARELLQDAPGATVVCDTRASRMVYEEIRKSGGMVRRERCGTAYIKKALADSKGVFAGELSGHYYFRDNWNSDSGMLTFVHLLNILTAKRQPLSSMVEPLKRYANSGEQNFHVDDPQAVIEQVMRKFAHGRVDNLDGVTVQYADWWFNVRPSRTEPLLRMNAEAATPDLLNRKLRELYPLLGTAADA